MSFEARLSEGKFCIPECTQCKKTVWPPSEFCNHCFGDVQLREGDFEGKVIEFSQQKEGYFCLVEFESIRIMAGISQCPKLGQTVRMSKCGIINASYSFWVV